MTVRPADQVVSRTTSRKAGPVAGFGNRVGLRRWPWAAR
jgi:hypothetical protein